MLSQYLNSYCASFMSLFVNRLVWHTDHNLESSQSFPQMLRLLLGLAVSTPLHNLRLVPVDMFCPKLVYYLNEVGYIRYAVV